MLSHRNRFHGHGSLKYTYRHGQIARGRSFTIKYVQNPRRVHPRFAVVVSKKIYKSAVKRNRIRRRIYEILRGEHERVRQSTDIVLTVIDPTILTTEYKELQEQLISLLEKNSLLR